MGGIVGNILSVILHEKRWFYYKIFLISLGVFIFASAFLVDYIIAYGSMWMLSFLAVCIGTVFGAAVNFMDGYYFLAVEKSRYKSLGAAVYGLIASLTIFLLMQGVSLLKQVEIHIPFFLCVFVVLVLWFLSRNIEKITTEENAE